MIIWLVLCKNNQSSHKGLLPGKKNDPNAFCYWIYTLFIDIRLAFSFLKAIHWLSLLETGKQWESLRDYLLVSLLHILQIPEVKLFLSVEFYKIAVDVLLLSRPISSFSVFLFFCLCLFPYCWDLARWSPFWSRSK